MLYISISHGQVDEKSQSGLVGNADNTSGTRHATDAGDGVLFNKDKTTIL